MGSAPLIDAVGGSSATAEARSPNPPAALGWDEAWESKFPPFSAKDRRPGRVVRVARGLCAVVPATGVARADTEFVVPRDPMKVVCTGDWVAVDPAGSGDVTKTNVKWKVPKTRWSYASPVIAGGYGYRATRPGLLTCWNAATGEQVFSERLEGISPLSSPFVTPDGRERAVEGRCEGRLTHEPRGGGGFGYDPAFVPDDYGDGRTMAELTPAEKDAISHRGRAARLLLRELAAEAP